TAETPYLYTLYMTLREQDGSVIEVIPQKVRILESSQGTAAQTRVLINSTDGVHTWGTVGVSENIIEASLQALVDSIEYWLLQQKGIL
ncbi:MAG: hypothetical protein J6Q00_05535, partial [Verrucomicrobia bacterium]|nr:hypothetical protein [Verrucomicrobiota bacterium]